MTDVRALRRFRSAGVSLAAAVTMVAALALAGVATPAGAAPPPVTGSISCSLSATSTFWPYLGYAQGLVGRRVGAHAKSAWKLQGTLSGCTGTQTGGPPTAMLPIDHGDVTVTARATGHQCTDVAADGLDVRKVRVNWFDAGGGALGTTRVRSGSLDVENVGVLPPFIPPPPPPSGPPTFSGSGTSTATSRVFPGQLVTLALVGDPIHLELPCSNTSPPLTQGIRGVTFSGVSGVSTVSVSP